ncbi:MAG: UDP-2,3-diacylglucosamine diphosphatase [Bacteroidales bacterium]|jgi:UDP-2,3-diacylglucosamine hydrolase|nr:UDP-2,3-diacylglucosamine diphosphatase [Bacteroidales bacterium]MCI2121976.1 UDP-2,3-diacylglucosamine diphosphatase [Bacteroidales bacterium]MCI2146119.1 UDP-2,3-diacylglucosamine diphosphatase [Bacteroidales bacterium]
MAGRTLYYFVSDVHLGSSQDGPDGREREFVAFLKKLPPETKALFLLGDIFDFWYEMKYVVPCGYVRTLSALADLVDSGVEVYFIRGNHDWWTFGYLENKIGLKVVDQPYVFDAGGKRFCVGHGDELGDRSFKRMLMRKTFRSPVVNSIFRFLPTGWSFAIAHRWSEKRKPRRKIVGPYVYKGKDEPLFKYLDNFNAKLKAGGEKGIDYYVFGHFHSEGEFDIESGGRIYMLGDWFQRRGFIYFSGTEISRGNLPNMET